MFGSFLDPNFWTFFGTIKIWIREKFTKFELKILTFLLTNFPDNTKSKPFQLSPSKMLQFCIIFLRKIRMTKWNTFSGRENYKCIKTFVHKSYQSFSYFSYNSDLWNCFLDNRGLRKSQPRYLPRYVGW